MKKNNKKGFVLAEAIISAVFILGIFTFLIANVFPLIYKYDRVLNYDNPEEVYSVNLFVDTLTELEYLKPDGITAYADNNICNFSDSDKKTYCEELIKENYLNITNVLFINGTTGTENVETIDITRGMREYAKYFIERKNSSKSKATDIGVLVRFGNAKYAGIWWNNDEE